MDRRNFLSSIAGLAVSLLAGDIPFFTLKVPSGEQDFVIVNGWVLTREDVAGRE